MSAEQVQVVESNEVKPEVSAVAVKPASKPGGGKVVKKAAKAKAKAKAKPKAADKPKPKAKAKPAKAKAAPKAAKKPKAPKVAKVIDYKSPRYIGGHNDQELNADQIRQLQALLDANGKELDRGDLKEAVGIGREGKYSAKWLDALWALSRKRPPLIVITNYEGDRKAYHYLTPEGREALKKAKLAAKAAAEAA